MERWWSALLGLAATRRDPGGAENRLQHGSHAKREAFPSRPASFAAHMHH